MNTQRDIIKFAFVKSYSNEVAKRLEKVKWNIPSRWKNQIDVVTDFLIDKNINTISKVFVFVNAQFGVFDFRMSKKCFNMNYPPVGVFKTNASMSRYIKHMNLFKSMRKCKMVVEKNIPILIHSEYGRAQCSRTGRLDIDKLKLSVMGGSVSTYTVAYVLLKFDVVESVCREVAELISLCKDDSLYEKYKEVKNLINKGELSE